MLFRKGEVLIIILRLGRKKKIPKLKNFFVGFSLTAKNFQRQFSLDDTVRSSQMRLDIKKKKKKIREKEKWKKKRKKGSFEYIYVHTYTHIKYIHSYAYFR